MHFSLQSGWQPFVSNGSRPSKSLGSGQPAGTLQSLGHTGIVPGLALSPDGTRLAASGVDGTVRLCGVDIDKLIGLALERVTRWFTPEECLAYFHTETCPPDPGP